MAMDALHVQTHPFFISLSLPLFGQSPCWLLGELYILAKSGWTGLTVVLWDLSVCASHSPLWRRYQQWTSLHKGALGLLPPRLRFPLRCLFDNCSQLCSHQGLVMVDLLDSFLYILKHFLAVESDSRKSLWQRKITANQLCQSRWQVERGAEAKSSANGRNLFTNHSTRYLHRLGCKYPNLVYISVYMIKFVRMYIYMYLVHVYMLKFRSPRNSV